jgi:hypothetical protein
VGCEGVEVNVGSEENVGCEGNNIIEGDVGGEGIEVNGDCGL